MSAAHTMNRYKFTCAGGAADVATRLVSGEDGLEDTIAALDAEFAREARDKKKESEGATDRTAGDKSMA